MTEAKPCLPGCTDMIGPLSVGVDHAWECPNHSRFANSECLPECPTIRQSGMPKHAPGCPNAAPKASEAPVEGYRPGRTKMGNLQPAPAPEPDPLKGIDAQKWAKEFMRIWAGRWSEVDEGLMIGWFANAIMRGFDEGQRRLRKQHGCELPPLAEPKPSAPPAPEPKQGSEEPIDIEKAFDSATAWIELNAARLGNIKLDGLTNLAEAFISLRNREKADYAAFVEMNAVFEAVMRAIRGEALSDFDLSHGSVYEANALRAEVERLKQLDIKPSTGSDLLWVEGKHRCAATISNNHLWQVEGEAEELRAQLAAADENLKTMLQAAGEEAERQLAAEKARADRAEERVKALENLVTIAVDQRWLSDVIAYLGPEARAILARARKDGGSNA